MSDQKESTGTENQALKAEDIGIEIDGGHEEEAGTETGENAEPETKDSQEPEEQNPPDEQTAQTQKPERPINQEAVERKINRAIKEKHEEQRKRERIEAQLKEARELLLKYEQKEIIVPAMPDVFDPDFDAKVKARDAALQEQARSEAQKMLSKQKEDEALRQQAQSEAEKITGYVQNMFKTASKIGIKEDDLKKADDTVASFIKDAQLAKYILSQDDAPLIINHLANNLDQLESVSRMSPIDAAGYIASVVAPAAKNYKPSLPTAPDPLDIPEGKAKSGKQSAFLDGVIFE